MKTLTKEEATLLLEREKQKLKSLEDKRQSLSQEQEKYKQKIREYESKNKIKFFGHPGKGHLGPTGVNWGPNDPQKQLLDAFRDSTKSIYTFTGGNRSGKTFLGVVVCLSAILGHFPWEDPKIVGHWIWELRGWVPPIKIRIVGLDWENHIKNVIVGTFKELIPDDIKYTTKKNNLGVENNFIFENGSTINILSNNQDPTYHEGWKGHLYWFDEPPKHPVWKVAATRLIDYRGIQLFTMTFKQDPWVYQKIVKGFDDSGRPLKYVFSVESSTFSNVNYGLSQEGLDQIKDQLMAVSPDTYQSAIEGKPVFLQGMVLKFDRDEHTIPRFEIPPDYPVDVAIDIGTKKQDDILFMATDRMGLKYLFLEYEISEDGYAIADLIAKAKEKYNLRINRVVCDPLASGIKIGKNTVWGKIEDGLNSYGMQLEVGEKLKEDGIKDINLFLSGRHGTPLMFVFDDLYKTIRQAENWLRDKEGKPSKKDDDMCENWYRLMLLDTEYESLEDERSYRPSVNKMQNRNKYTGY